MINVQSTMLKAFNQTIDVLGLPATLTPAGGGAAVPLTKVGFASLGRQDETLVNTFGVAAKVITIRASDMGTLVPHKFDSVQLTGTSEKFVLAAVHAIHSGVLLLGWKCFVKGTS